MFLLKDTSPLELQSISLGSFIEDVPHVCGGGGSGPLRTGLVFGMSRGGRSHKALAYLLQVSGSHAGPKGLMERWQRGGGHGAALAESSPSVPVQ